MVKSYRVFCVAIFLLSVAIFSCRTDVDSSGSGDDSSKKSTFINTNKCSVEVTKIQPCYKADTVIGNPTFEYVEISALTDGTLNGLQLYSAYYGEKKKYVFPKISVTAGEKIIVHLRSGDPLAGYVNELSSDLNAATAHCAISDERDLWDFSNFYNAKGSSRLQKSCDIVILKWGDTNEYADIVPYTKYTDGVWEKKFTPIINAALDLGFWDNDLMIEAVDCNGYSITSPMQKISSAHTKSSWSVLPVSNSLGSDKNTNSSSNSSTTQGGNHSGAADNETAEGSDDLESPYIDPLDIEITKIQPKYSSVGPIFEYIEVTALESGNIAGYKLYSVGNGISRAYTFPNYEITAGEKIIVHLRSYCGAFDELTSNLSQCTISGAFDGERDFWDMANYADSASGFTSGNSRLADDGDIVILCDSNNNYCDVVPYASSKKTAWPNDSYVTTLESAINRSFWIASDIAPSFSPNSTKCKTNAPLVKIAPLCSTNSWVVGTSTTKSYNPNGQDNPNGDIEEYFDEADDLLDESYDAVDDDIDKDPPHDSSNNSTSSQPDTQSNSNKGESASDISASSNSGGVGLGDGGEPPNSDEVFNDFDDPKDDATSDDGADLGVTVPGDFTFACSNIAPFDMSVRERSFKENGYTLSKRDGVNALISEIQPTYFSKENQTVFYNEYIELYFKTGGDLNSLSIGCMQSSGSIKTLKLPSVKISDGEVVVIHLANKGEVGCVSELGNDFNKSTAPYSAPNARDIWLNEKTGSGNPNTSVLPNTLGAILLYDSDGAVLDFVIYFGDYSAIGYIPLPFEKAVKFAIDSGLWTAGHYKNSIDNASVGFYITGSKNPCTRAYNPVKDIFYTGHEAWFQNVSGGTPGSILNPEQ